MKPITPASSVAPLIPFSAGVAPARFQRALVVPFAMERRHSLLLRPAETVELYRRWRAGSLRLNPVERRRVLSEVEIEDRGESYRYHYPIDLDYLLSPEWRTDNLSSPAGFLRWNMEMDVALGLNAIQGYEGRRIASSFLNSALRMIRSIEEGECGYRMIQLSTAKALSLHTFLNHLDIVGGMEPFLGNNRQTALAEKEGIGNLGQLFSALSNLTDPSGKSWAEMLGYNRIAFPTATVAALLRELEAGWEKYRGNDRQMALAEKVGIGHLCQLYVALSNLTDPSGKSWAEVLGYNRIDFPAAKVAALLRELEAGWERYRGNDRQAALAEKVGISHLRQLFSALTNLTSPSGKSWAEVLGYNRIKFPVAKVAAFFADMIRFVEDHRFPIKIFVEEFAELSPADCERRFEEIRGQVLLRYDFIP